MIFPRFETTFLGSLDEKGLDIFRQKLLSSGGKAIHVDPKNIQIEVFGSNLALAVTFHSTKMIVTAKESLTPGQMYLKIYRVGERQFYLGFFALFAVGSVMLAISERKWNSLLTPVVVYGVSWAASFVPYHPSIMKIKRMFRESNV